MPGAFGNINMRLTVDEVDALIKWRRLNREGPESFEKAARRAGQAGARAGRQTSGGMANVARTAGRAAAALLGVGSAVGALITFTQVLRREIEEIRRRQGLAGSSQVAFGDAFRRATFALGKGSDLSTSQLRELILADTSGVSPVSLALESEAALSASGDLSKRRAFATVQAAAAARPELDTESRRALVSGGLALQKAFGSTPEASIAGIIQSLSAARTEELNVFSKNMISAIAQSTAFGNDKDSFRFLSSLFIGVGQRSEDPTGRRTATNTIIFMKQISELLKQRGVVPASAGFQESLNALLSGAPGSEAEKLRQELAGVFDKQIDELPREFEKIGKSILLGEARQKPALLELLDRSKTSKTWEQIKSAQDKVVGLNQQAIDIVAAQLAELRSMPDQQASDNERIFNSALEKQRILSETGITGVSTEKLAEILARTGQFAQEANLRTFLNSVAAESRTPEEQISAQQALIDRVIAEGKREGFGFDTTDLLPILGLIQGAAVGAIEGGLALGPLGAIGGAVVGGGAGFRAGAIAEGLVAPAPDEREQRLIDALEALREQLELQRLRIVSSDFRDGVAIKLTILDSDGRTKPSRAEVPE